MEHYKQYGVVSSSSSSSSSFFHIFLLFISLAAIFDQSYSSELRPSDHGLAYQETSSPTKDNVPEMLSFFNGKDKTAPLPVAKNLTASTNTWWKSDGTDGRSRDGGRGDHVRVILLLTSLVCGLTGIVLLLTSALVFLMRYRKRKREDRSASTSLSNAIVKVDVV